MPDNKAQMKYRKTNLKQFTVDLKPELLEDFKTICAAKGTTATTEIKKFITEYCEKNKWV